jgi:P2-related tail formation protein
LAELTLQPSINDLRSRAHLALIERLAALDLSPIQVYNVAACVDSAVLPLAWQWDVLNPLLLPEVEQVIAQLYPSWDVIANLDVLSNIDILQYGAGIIEAVPLTFEQLMAAYRALILLSTSLHSIVGTVGAVRQALTSLGFPNAIILEGQNSWGGHDWPPEQGWAVFRVLIDLFQSSGPIDLTTVDKRVRAIVNFWKPARSWLDTLQFGFNIHESVIPAPFDFLLSAFVQRDVLFPAPYDVITAPLWPMHEKKTIVPYWNARYYHTSVTYGQNEPDVAEGPLLVNGNAIAH